MTDRETLIEMFNRNKIEFEEQESGELWVEARYIGFVSYAFAFREDGSLESVKAYE